LITTYLYYWSSFIIKTAKEKNFKVLDLNGKKANKKMLESYIDEHQPQYIHFNGHGSENLIAGFDNKILVEVDDNDYKLKNKIVYALSCDSAKLLGKQLINKGTRSYIGYKRKFVLVYNLKSLSRPLSDKLAKFFLEPSNLISIALLKGNKVQDAYRRSQDTMQKNLLYMLSTKAQQQEKDAASFLWANKKSQVVFGDPEAKI